MLKKIIISKDLSAHPGRLHMLPRWRMVVIALILALNLGSLPAVKAQETVYSSFVDVIDPSPLTMCIGETTEFLVQILWTNTPVSDINDVPNDANNKGAITLGQGASITGEVSNSNVGDFTTAHTMLINSPSPSLVRPAMVSFTFKAKKTGETSITFTGDVVENGQTFRAKPSQPVRVKIIPCKYMVIAISRWSASYPGGSIKISGDVYNAYIKADPEGSFRGTGDVVYIASESVPGCGAANSFALGTVSIGGFILDDQLNVQLDYKPAKWNDVVSCPRGSGSSNGNASAAKLNLAVPLSGDTVHLKQDIRGGPGSAPGSADVYIIPLPESK
jgi:hypothetical protein